MSEPGDGGPEKSLTKANDSESLTKTGGKRKRRFRFRYVALGMFLLLIGGEIGARVLADRNSRFNMGIGGSFEWDPHRRVRWQKNYQSPTFRTNSRGFPGDDFEAKKPPDTYRVFCLGDSCTVAPSSYNYPVALQKALNAAMPGRHIEVINAGCPGYDSFQARTWYVEEIDGYEHDMVVIYVGWNDMGQYNPDGLVYKRDASGYLKNPTLIERALLSSYLLRSVYFVTGLLESRGDVLTEPLTGDEAKKYGEFYPTHFEKNLTEVITLAKSRGRKVYVCSYAGIVVPDPTPDEKARIHFPRGMGKSLPKYLKLLESYKAALRNVAAATGTPIIDLADGFKDAESRKCFTDSCHFNPEGSDRIASQIAPVISKDIAAFFR